MTTASRASCAVANSSGRVFLNIVPVIVSSNGKEIAVYAFLDQGSTTTLCTQDLLAQLGVEGEDANYSITTVNQTTTCRSGKKVNINVSSLDKANTVELAEVYAVDSLPIKPNPPLVDSNISEWSHLKDLRFPRIPQGKVMLLIGISSPELFWTLDERRGRPYQPYAVRTILGWSLIGSGTKNGNRNSLVNFVRKSDELLEKQVECLWKMDEVKPSGMLLEHEMSKNDRYALKLMQDSKRLIDGHYQLSLPWRPGAPSLKSNYPQALQRLKCLQNRFEKNANLKQLYVQEVEEYVSKGYA